MAERFPRVYNQADFGLTADVTCQPNMWNKVGQVTVPAQQMVAFGATNVKSGGAEGEPVYYEIADTTNTPLKGKIRFALANANETNQSVILEQRTERLLASTTGDRNVSVLLMETNVKAKQDSKLIIYFYPDSASAVIIDYDAALTSALIPVTVYQ